MEEDFNLKIKKKRIICFKCEDTFLNEDNQIAKSQ